MATTSTASPPSEYTTEGVHLASWLILSGHALKEFRMADDNERGQFVFDVSPTLAKDVEAYFTSAAVVNLRAYIRVFNRSRDAMMDARRAANGIVTTGKRANQGRTNG